MVTEIQAATDFQTRMFGRVRDSMGDLMTDDELKKIVETAVEKAFFTKQQVRVVNGYGGSPQYVNRESVFVEEIRALLEPKVKEAIGVWFRANDEKITAELTNLFKDGFMSAVIKHFDNALSGKVMDLQASFSDVLRKLGQS